MRPSIVILAGAVLPVLACLVVFVCVSGCGNSGDGIRENVKEPAKPKGWVRTAPVADLIGTIRQDEDWIWDVKSFSLKAEGKWENTQDGINDELSRLELDFPQLDFTRQDVKLQFWSLLPEVSENLSLSWDKTRIAVTSERKDISLDRRFFDGNRTFIREIYFARKQEHYALDKDPNTYISPNALTDFSFGRITCPKAWWYKQLPNYLEFVKHAETAPDQYEDKGIRKRDSKEYRVLYRQCPMQELWMDCDNNRLAYIKSYFHPNTPRKYEESLRSQALRMTALIGADMLLDSEPKTFSFLKDLRKVLEEEPEWPSPERSEQVVAALERAARESPRAEPAHSAESEFSFICLGGALKCLVQDRMISADLQKTEENLRALLARNPNFFEKMHDRYQTGWREYVKTRMPEYTVALEPQPFSEFIMKDWREIAPGKWFPFEQGHCNWITHFENAGKIAAKRSIRITDLRINNPLPDSLFQMEMKEGVKVHDWGHSPPLHYRYKVDFTRKEWNDIVKKAEEEAGEQAAWDAKQKALIGKPTPPLHVEKWIQGDPLTLESLKGKFVVLDFFAEWCGPCRNAYPVLVNRYLSLDKTKSAIIGIHPPGSHESDITELLKLYKIEYPVAVDEADEQGASWGRTFSDYEIHAIPHAVLIDRSGKVAAHGRVASVLSQLNRLESAP